MLLRSASGKTLVLMPVSPPPPGKEGLLSPNGTNLESKTYSGNHQAADVNLKEANVSTVCSIGGAPATLQIDSGLDAEHRLQTIAEIQHSSINGLGPENHTDGNAIGAKVVAEASSVVNGVGRANAGRLPTFHSESQAARSQQPSPVDRNPSSASVHPPLPTRIISGNQKLLTQDSPLTINQGDEPLSNLPPPRPLVSHPPPKPLPKKQDASAGESSLPPPSPGTAFQGPPGFPGRERNSVSASSTLPLPPDEYEDLPAKKCPDSAQIQEKLREQLRRALHIDASARSRLHLSSSANELLGKDASTVASSLNGSTQSDKQALEGDSDDVNVEEGEGEGDDGLLRRASSLPDVYRDKYLVSNDDELEYEREEAGIGKNSPRPTPGEAVWPISNERLSQICVLAVSFVFAVRRHTTSMLEKSGCIKAIAHSWWVEWKFCRSGTNQKGLQLSSYGGKA